MLPHMLSRPRRLLVGAAVAAVTLTAATGVASARNVYVIEDVIVTPAVNNCTMPNSNTINGGVAQAAPGDRVVVCAGTYAEQVKVDKSIELRGIDQPKIVPPPVLDTSGALVEFTGATTKALIQRFTIQGPYASPTA